MDEEEVPSVELFWFSPNDRGPQIHEYKVKALECATEKVEIMLNGTSAPKYTYENLNAGHQYRFSVAAIRGKIASTDRKTGPYSKYSKLIEIPI